MKIKNRAELMEFLSYAEQKVRKYGWQNKVTHPYPNVPMTAMDVINECREYDICTSGTKSYLIALAAGFWDRLEAWERYELKPKMQVRIKKTGKIATILQEDFEIFADLVEVI